MSSPAPIILLCPGRGVLAEYNTSLAEDLASHGFAVFAFDSPGIGHVIYPDGHEISPSPTYRPSSDLFLGPYEAVDKFFEPAVTLGAGDANFVFNQIVSLNLRDPANRFTGKINTKRIGIYGHSLGGRICGEVAARNRFVKAFAAMEAVPPRSIRREGEIKAPILMMYSSELPEELALPNIEGVIPNRKNDVFIARLEGLGHNSSTDLPLITDNSYQYQARPEEGVRVTRLLLAGFFNATLKNGDFPSADINAEECIRLRIYEGAARR
ncbi:MAG: alpha/beta fold hydrolase [Pseudomonadota bacterium]